MRWRKWVEKDMYLKVAVGYLTVKDILHISRSDSIVLKR